MLPSVSSANWTRTCLLYFRLGVRGCSKLCCVKGWLCDRGLLFSSGCSAQCSGLAVAVFHLGLALRAWLASVTWAFGSAFWVGLAFWVDHRMLALVLAVRARLALVSKAIGRRFDCSAFGLVWLGSALARRCDEFSAFGVVGPGSARVVESESSGKCPFFSGAPIQSGREFRLLESLNKTI